MAIFVNNKKALESLKLRKVKDIDKLAGNDIFETVEGATATIGRFKNSKGYLAENWTYTYEEILFIHKGSIKFVIEGKTIIVREGDIVYVEKGTTFTTISTDEGCELLAILIPSLKMLGIPLLD